MTWWRSLRSVPKSSFEFELLGFDSSIHLSETVVCNDWQEVDWASRWHIPFDNHAIVYRDINFAEITNTNKIDWISMCVVLIWWFRSRLSCARGTWCVDSRIQPYRKHGGLVWKVRTPDPCAKEELWILTNQNTKSQCPPCCRWNIVSVQSTLESLHQRQAVGPSIVFLLFYRGTLNWPDKVVTRSFDPKFLTILVNSSQNSYAAHEFWLELTRIDKNLGVKAHEFWLELTRIWGSRHMNFG